mgnify:CR=1 FL=1
MQTVKKTNQELTDETIATKTTKKTEKETTLIKEYGLIPIAKKEI